MDKAIAAITVEQLHNLKDDEVLEIGMLSIETSPNRGYVVIDPFGVIIWTGDEESVVGFVNGFNGHCEEEDEPVATTTDSGGVLYEALKIAVRLLLDKYSKEDLHQAILEELHDEHELQECSEDENECEICDQEYDYIDCMYMEPTAYDILMDTIDEETGSSVVKDEDKYDQKNTEGVAAHFAMIKGLAQTQESVESKYALQLLQQIDAYKCYIKELEDDTSDYYADELENQDRIENLEGLLKVSADVIGSDEDVKNYFYTRLGETFDVNSDESMTLNETVKEFFKTK
ncbi:hypothetical protein [Brevibacillus sp. NRS-1366]|uniref:hypothetical protein n=1 Tax=Brevibacillus sp. NRS-1366 TaxID=3233899 RepID=UPI003D1FCE5E